MANIALRTVHWASVSGGKDSLYMLKLILENPQKYPIDGIVHFELEIDYPFIKEVIAKMKEMVAPLGIPFRTYKPRKSFNELYEIWGFPTRKARWCNDKYKLDCKKQLEEDLKEYAQKPMYYIGFCADEEKRFKYDVGERTNAQKEIYPIAEEGITEDVILEWAKTAEIFNGYYETNTRCGCYMCPMATMENDKYLYTHYPDLFADKMSKAAATEKKRTLELGRPFSVWQCNPKYNTEYRVKRILERLEKEK